MVKKVDRYRVAKCPDCGGFMKKEWIKLEKSNQIIIVWHCRKCGKTGGKKNERLEEE